MNEAERREFLTQFIEKVEIYEEEQENGQWLKSMEFKIATSKTGCTFLAIVMKPEGQK